jgi:hypothetical protein
MSCLRVLIVCVVCECRLHVFISMVNIGDTHYKFVAIFIYFMNVTKDNNKANENANGNVDDAILF